MKERKITEVQDFLGKENILTKEVVSDTTSEKIEVINATTFLDILRKRKIMKRWEDLDENLQEFLGISKYN